MKKIIVTAFVLLSLQFPVHAQADKIVKYCELAVNERSNLKAQIKISYGKADSLSLFINSMAKKDLDKVESFGTVPDALNHMSSLGWNLIGVVNNAFIGSFRFYFIKEFDKSELLDK